MPAFETLLSEKTIKLGLGRARFLAPYKDFSCEPGDQQLARRNSLMPLLFSGVTTLQIRRKVMDFIWYLFMEQRTRRKEREEKSGLTLFN